MACTILYFTDTTSYFSEVVGGGGMNLAETMNCLNHIVTIKNNWKKTLSVLSPPSSSEICKNHVKVPVKGPPTPHLIEMVLLSTHNICFGWEIKKIIFQYALLSGGLVRGLTKSIWWPSPLPWSSYDGTAYKPSSQYLTSSQVSTWSWGSRDMAFWQHLIKFLCPSPRP